MKQRSILAVLAITALTFSVGCGKMQGSGAASAASQSTSSSSSGSDFVDQTNQDIATFNQQNAALQQQVSSLNSQIDSISLTTLESGSSAKATPVGAVAAIQVNGNPARMQSLQSTIQGLLDNVYKGVSALYTQVDSLQTKIQNDIAKLNLNDPAQVAEGAALEESLVYIQQAKTKLDTLVNTLESKVQTFVTGINTKLATLTASNPLYLIAELYWAQIEPLFTNFDTELTALTQ